MYSTVVSMDSQIHYASLEDEIHNMDIQSTCGIKEKQGCDKIDNSVSTSYKYFTVQVITNLRN